MGFLFPDVGLVTLERASVYTEAIGPGFSASCAGRSAASTRVNTR